MRPTDDTDPATTRRDASDDEIPAPLAGSTIVSAVRAGSQRISSWVRHSAIYQWLTAEPDPEVIVIDLRETWTVGPVLRVLDRVVDRFVDAAEGSRAVAIATRGSTAAIAAPLRVGGLVLAALGIVVAASGVLGESALTRVAVGVGLAVAGVIAMQDDRDWATLRETRPVELAIAAFEPPAPPDAADDEDADGQSGSSQTETESQS